MGQDSIVIPFARYPERLIPRRSARVIYQVYPLTFYDSNGDGIGDLPGVTEKLPYIASLGVDTIWLSPIFLSPDGPDGDNGYAPTDRRAVDAKFGTLGDFRRLVREAHALGLMVLSDFVLCHTSDRHPGFLKSVAGETHFADRYVWHPGIPNGEPGLPRLPNNWLTVHNRPAWTWHQDRGAFYLHHFLASQPALNLNREDVQDAVIADMKFWIDQGVDGFRLDAVPFANHDPGFADNPWIDPQAGTQRENQRFAYSMCQPQTVEFLKRMRAQLDDHAAARGQSPPLLLGEVIDGREGGKKPTEVAAEYRNSLDSCYSFLTFWRRYPTSWDLKDMIAYIERHFPDGGHCHTLGNHDFSRFRSRMADLPPAARRQLRILACCLPGDLCLYQGDELDLTDADIPAGLEKDWMGRDPSRSPMSWTNERHAGFSAAEKSYLPVPDWHYFMAVEHQKGGFDSALDFTRRLIGWRQAQPALLAGDIIVIEAPEPMVPILRVSPEQTLLCLFNISNEPAVITPSHFMDRRFLHELRLGIDKKVEIGPYGHLAFGAREPAYATRPLRTPVPQGSPYDLAAE